MKSTRRLALSLLCATSLSAALVAASPAVAVQPLQPRDPACGAADQDYNGTFAGTFDKAPGDTIAVAFSAPDSVTTDWVVEGWKGHGSGTFELIANGVKWNNSNSVSGPATGVDTETYRSTNVTCAAGTSEVETINGEVFAPTATGGTVTYAFTVTRRS
ncbi:hypothetical protein GCM10009760_15630 [Kitasatospora kazusensis]|uniref:Uncharacterized protein n=1 Tax=Kitasatospora kazusensis TaxID=407974 RepID=A0ABP5KUH0_9ACTN